MSSVSRRCDVICFDRNTAHKEGFWERVLLGGGGGDKENESAGIGAARVATSILPVRTRQREVFKGAREERGGGR